MAILCVIIHGYSKDKLEQIRKVGSKFKEIWIFSNLSINEKPVNNSKLKIFVHDNKNFEFSGYKEALIQLSKLDNRYSLSHVVILNDTLFVSHSFLWKLIINYNLKRSITGVLGDVRSYTHERFLASWLFIFQFNLELINELLEYLEYGIHESTNPIHQLNKEINDWLLTNSLYKGWYGASPHLDSSTFHRKRITIIIERSLSQELLRNNIVFDNAYPKLLYQIAHFHDRLITLSKKLRKRLLT